MRRENLNLKTSAFEEKKLDKFEVFSLG